MGQEQEWPRQPACTSASKAEAVHGAATLAGCRKPNKPKGVWVLDSPSHEALSDRASGTSSNIFIGTNLSWNHRFRVSVLPYSKRRPRLDVRRGNACVSERAIYVLSDKRRAVIGEDVPRYTKHREKFRYCAARVLCCPAPVKSQG